MFQDVQRGEACGGQAAGADEVHLVPRGAPLPVLPPADLVFDPVGGTDAAALLTALRRRGRYLIVGFVGGIAVPPFDWVAAGEIEVIGVRAGEFARRDPAGGIANLAAIDGLAAQLVPTIGLEAPPATAATAFRAMANGDLIGKAVLDCR